MEEIIRIQNVQFYTSATPDQMRQLMKRMSDEDAKDLIVLPDPSNPDQYEGILLTKYYTPKLSKLLGVADTKQDGCFHYLIISTPCIRSFLSVLLRRIVSGPRQQTPAPSAFDELLQLAADAEKDYLSKQPRPIPRDPITEFLNSQSPVKIQQALNEWVIGQNELTAAVADFLYYHALRQLHPELPQRPLLIAGPSGSGKTEVWRAASRLYGTIFPIKVIDGSSMSCDGWAGSFKISSFVDRNLAGGGILVVDEFDKLTKPRISSGGSNVSLEMQAEFLKLVEGEYQITENKKQTGLTSLKMGFVLIGAFENLLSQREAAPGKQPPKIGFCAEAPAPQSPACAANTALTDADFIAHGIMPELVGRIAAKCTTAQLTDKVYLQIIRGPQSRVALLERILTRYGADLSHVLSDEELRALIAASKNNRTGVRWVAAQVESRLLEAIRENGLFPDKENAHCGAA